MGLLGGIFGLPLAPVRAVLSLGRVIQQQVDRELYDPASIRAELEEIEKSRDEGVISPEDEARQQQEIVDRMTGRPDHSPAPDRGDQDH